MHYLKIITDRNGLIKQYAEQVEKLPAKFEFSANLISHKLFNIIQFVKTGADEKDYSLDIKVMLARYLNVIRLICAGNGECYCKTLEDGGFIFINGLFRDENICHHFRFSELANKIPGIVEGIKNLEKAIKKERVSIIFYSNIFLKLF